MKKHSDEFNFVTRNQLTGSFTFKDETVQHFLNGQPCTRRELDLRKEISRLAGEMKGATPFQGLALSGKIHELTRELAKEPKRPKI